MVPVSVPVDVVRAGDVPLPYPAHAVFTQRLRCLRQVDLENALDVARQLMDR